MTKEETSFFNDIKKFNELYKFPNNPTPKLQGVQRLENFKSILMEEVHEVDEIIKFYKEKETSLSEEDKVQILTHLSDWLGDIVIFAASEATKHGIDLNKTLEIIMQSNFSKLGADGNPIYDERGKLLKGPNYWKPEPKISELIKESLTE